MEQMYPDKRARAIALAVTDGMSVNETVLAHIIAFETAYLEAGGRIVYP